MKEDFYNINTDLLVKYLLEEASHSERELVLNWLAEDASNRRYYAHFKLIWEQSRQHMPGKISEDAAWTRLQNRINKTKQLAAPKVIGNPRFAWMRIAAIFLFVIAGSWLAMNWVSNRHGESISVRSGKGIEVDTLPDGSIITLNKNSALIYPTRFANNSRKIRLEGEAFFNVSPDKRKPFIIQVNDITVKVVGTSFNIKNIDGNTEVIVETGVVEVIKNSHSVSLTPGQQIIVHQKDSILRKQPVTDQLYNYYRTKKFYCENTPLWKLVQALNEAYNVNITISRRDLRMLPLTTVFEDEPLENILSVISETFKISVTRTGDQIILQ